MRIPCMTKALGSVDIFLDTSGICGCYQRATYPCVLLCQTPPLHLYLQSQARMHCVSPRPCIHTFRASMRVSSSHGATTTAFEPLELVVVKLSLLLIRSPRRVGESGNWVDPERFTTFRPPVLLLPMAEAAAVVVVAVVATFAAAMVATLGDRGDFLSAASIRRLELRPSTTLPPAGAAGGDRDSALTSCTLPIGKDLRANILQSAAPVDGRRVGSGGRWECRAKRSQGPIGT